MDATYSPPPPPPESPDQSFIHPPNPFRRIASGDELVPITALVFVSVLAMFLLHVLGSLRRGSSHKILHIIVLGAYTLSYTLVSYTLGLMQASHHYHNYVEFPVWAVCLLLLLGGTDELMACNLNDVDNWKSFHMTHLLKGGFVIYIVAVYGRVVPEYKKPLWGILLVIVLQSCAWIKSMMMASKSNPKSLKAIVEYMEHEHQLAAGNESFEPLTMEGYRYVVAGEDTPKEYVKRQKHVSRNNGFHFGISRCFSSKNKDTFVEIQERNIITLEQIWRCKGSLLHSERGLRLKDVCLSMALSKMLNRRFAGCKLHEAGLHKTHDFVFGGLLQGEEPYERAFRVIKVELDFVYDLYYTRRYPYLYRKARYFAVSLPIVMVILCSWLTYQLFKNTTNLTIVATPLS